jgi:hypothetical protein
MSHRKTDLGIPRLQESAKVVLASAVKNDTGLAAPKGCLKDRLAARKFRKNVMEVTF